MACVRWAETATWPAVLRGPMAGREQRGKLARGASLCCCPSMVGPWRHRWPMGRGGDVRLRMRARGGGARSLCQPTFVDPTCGVSSSTITQEPQGLISYITEHTLSCEISFPSRRFPPRDHSACFPPPLPARYGAAARAPGRLARLSVAPWLARAVRSPTSSASHAPVRG
jgi:hypothetical protein